MQQNKQRVCSRALWNTSYKSCSLIFLFMGTKYIWSANIRTRNDQVQTTMPESVTNQIGSENVSKGSYLDDLVYGKIVVYMNFG